MSQAQFQGPKQNTGHYTCCTVQPFTWHTKAVLYASGTFKSKVSCTGKAVSTGEIQAQNAEVTSTGNVLAQKACGADKSSTLEVEVEALAKAVAKATVQLEGECSGDGTTYGSSTTSGSSSSSCAPEKVVKIHLGRRSSSKALCMQSRSDCQSRCRWTDYFGVMQEVSQQSRGYSTGYDNGCCGRSCKG